MGGRQAERESAAVCQPSGFRDLRAGWAAAPAHHTADTAAQRERAVPAPQRPSPHLPDRPRGPRQRAGGQFAAENPGKKNRKHEFDFIYRKMLRYNTYEK